MEPPTMSWSTILLFSNWIWLISYISLYEEISNEERLKTVCWVSLPWSSGFVSCIFKCYVSMCYHVLCEVNQREKTHNFSDSLNLQILSLSPFAVCDYAKTACFLFILLFMSWESPSDSLTCWMNHQTFFYFNNRSFLKVELGKLNTLKHCPAV